MVDKLVDIPHGAAGIVTEADDDMKEFAATREFYRWMVDINDSVNQLNADMAALTQSVNTLRADLVAAGVIT